MSHHNPCRPGAPLGARRRSSNLTGLPVDGFLSVIKQLLYSDGTQQDGGGKRDCAREKMQRELNRLRSFERCPAAAQVSSADLASSGFFYVGPNDRVQCFSCGGVLKCRSFRGSAMQEHRKYFPFCHFAMGREVGNIPKHQPVDHSLSRRRGPQSMGAEAPSLNHPAKPDMACEWQRKSSFRSWPREAKVQPSQLSKAGFYYTGFDDRVRCFCCSVGIGEWERHNDPWKKHAQYSPRCEYLKQQKGPDFIRAVQEQYCEGPSSAAEEQRTGRSTAQRQGLDSAPIPPSTCAAPSQSLFAPSLFTYVTSPLMQAVITGDFEQATQQMFQGSLMQHVRSWDPFSSLCPEISLGPDTFDLTIDSGSSEGPVSSQQQADGCPVSSESAEPVSRNHSAGGACASAAGTSGTIKEQLRQLQEERVCKICMDNQVSVVFVPCGHLVVCTECAPELSDCPICRASIHDTIRTFMS
ncbi:baculoviral IAP repeat-containing protein 7 isoform X2 [Pleurodeles waltl]|uniref:baculoviral IAP repeat-containing protein 7 isoform X2 n=1 Tax=Pleurodeles waltl TaxID=8319 RepID=UPI003709A828